MPVKHMVPKYKDIHAFDYYKTMNIIFSMYTAGEVSVHRACCERAAQPYSLGRGGMISSTECYSVLRPFLTKMSIIYRWNQHQMFYLQSSLDVAYHISMRIYKLFNLAPLPKNDFTLVLYCSMSILNQ